MQNRETSWLKFNERVLEEANNPETPIFERLFFLSVFTTNLDEFFMVRVGGFQELAFSGSDFIDSKTGMTAKEVLTRILQDTVALYPARDHTYALLESELAREGFPRRKPADLSPAESARFSHYYTDLIEPLLAPQIVDKTHPFPHIENKRLIVAVSLETKGGWTFGMIPLPRDTDRLYFTDDGGYILLEDVILHYAERIFKKQTVVEKTVICVTRNADMDTLDEPFEADEDFRDHMSKLLKRKKRLAPVRLEVVSDDCRKLVDFLKKRLKLGSDQVFHSAAPLDLGFYGALRDKTKPHVRAKLSFPPFEPAEPVWYTPGESLIRRVRKGDILLSLPFESLDPFLSLIREASEDERVLSIQITLYRLAGRSRLAESLIAAAERGKDVFVFIELRARMDEENNIVWAKRLEDAGCTVFYGNLDYKMHAKICLITRRESGKHEFITQIGTGNYNEKTAKLYTDLSIVTTDKKIAQDAVRFFHNMMTDVTNDIYPVLWIAPREFKQKLIEYIGREASLGADGYVAIKCNSLSDKDVIEALVNASIAGAKIHLIIRGICCLVSGISGLTDNIRVRSIVGRFLEHSRIYRFGRSDDAELFIGSGDMMTRNTQRRIELFTPVWDKELRSRLFEMMEILLRDNVKARILTANGAYIPCTIGEGEAPLDSQAFFMEQSTAADSAAAETHKPGSTVESGYKPKNLIELLRGILNRFKRKA
ncbi:MAG: polyphosphate kinase 1 [Clostridiales Family XIII bacterium]|jgi:polyphosphate kinase|nr:polyphosphate kinase 1 [Clostridiales Family XIII bacterium]